MKQRANWVDVVVWLPLALLSLPVALKISEMLLVCLIYGADSYFSERLRIVSYAPLTLSNGREIDLIFFQSVLVLWVWACLWFPAYKLAIHFISKYHLLGLGHEKQRV